ncbi:MAG: hydrogenase maturation protease [Deltaproteobacteria bacterium]|nr:hydrogenase maturation protease [Deltaproteobacteria bacterium]
MRIIGLGNLWLKDEGVGIHVVRELGKESLPPEVEVLEGGLAGIGLLGLFQGAAKVVLVDAAEMGRPPGTVERFTPGEIKIKTGRVSFSTHDMGLLETLELARGLGPLPEIVILGIQPGEISWGAELTPAVQAAVQEACRAAWKEVQPP